MKLILISLMVAAASAIVPTAHALPNRQLFNTCNAGRSAEKSSDNEGSKMFCTAYVLGVADTIKLYSNILDGQPREVCIPDPTVALQLVEVYLNYVEHHPEVPDDVEATVVIYTAFRHTYPCPVSKVHK